MKFLTTVLVCTAFALLPRQAYGTYYYGGSTGGGGGGGPSYILQETFEGTGYFGTWGEFGTGTVNEDYTSTVLDGSQSLFIDGTTAFAGTEWDSGSSRSELWIYMLYRPTALPAGSDRQLFLGSSASGGSGTILWSVFINNLGKLAARNNTSTSSYTADAMSTGTTYHIFIHGKSSDRSVEVGFSTDGTKPTSGNKYTSITGGSSGTAPRYFSLKQTYTSSSGGSGIFDKVYFSTTAIGDNP